MAHQFPVAMDVLIREAQPADVAAAFELINDAYEVETGNSGVGFKHTKRFLSHDELQPQLQHAFSATIDGRLAGIIVYSFDSPGSCHFGPFAVGTWCQGRKVGKALMTHLETFAAGRGCSQLRIEVVNHRSDIIPMYKKLGYEEYGTAPFPAPERITRPCHFVLMQKPIGPAAGASATGSAGPATGTASSGAAGSEGEALSPHTV